MEYKLYLFNSPMFFNKLIIVDDAVTIFSTIKSDFISFISGIMYQLL
jgi:hypothetical protein